MTGCPNSREVRRKGLLLDEYSFSMNMCSLRINIVLAHRFFSYSLLISEGSVEVTITFLEGRHSYCQDCPRHGLPVKKLMGKSSSQQQGYKMKAQGPVSLDIGIYWGH